MISVEEIIQIAEVNIRKQGTDLLKLILNPLISVSVDARELTKYSYSYAQIKGYPDSWDLCEEW